MLYQKKLFQLSIIILLGTLLLACTPPKPKTPMAVAEAFWHAALAGDIDTAKQYLTPDSRNSFKIILQSSKDYVELGEQSISAQRAEILTQLVQHQSDQNQARRTALRTILVNQQGHWLVDFNQTRDSMLGTELQSALEQFSKTMRETIDKGVQIMGESMKKELEEMEQSMQELNQELDREMQKELEQQKQNPTAPPKTETQEPPKTTTL